MPYFYEEILEGIPELPCSGAPGIMVVTGDKAQAIFTCENSGDVFLAASEYGNGRVFVSSHDCYLGWLKDKTGGLEGDFIKKVKNWLTRNEEVDDSNTIEAIKLKDDSDMRNYKLVIWAGNKVLNDGIIEKIREFVENGGGLFCGMTPWGYIQSSKNKNVTDIQLYQFLKNYTGIILTDRYSGQPKRIPLNKNKARYSNFNKAINEISQNSNEIKNYCDTIDCCIDNLSRCGIVDYESIEKLKDSLLKQCEEKAWQPCPTENSPIKNEDVKQITKMLCRCYVELGEKAPKIKHFPFDFEELPPLSTDVELKLNPKHSERLSTGYYLPAGIEMTVKVTKGDHKGWKCRIGAHSDHIKANDEYRRWPICYVLKNLKPELKVKSPFGGLVYFDSPNSSDIDVVISNVVEAPYFDVTKPEYCDNWDTNRQKPGLWAELAGKYIIITCPSESIRDLDNPKELTDFWDEVVVQHHKCRGSNINSQKRERVVCDKQASAGYMHSGYPIVTHLDVCESKCKHCILDVEKMRTVGSWGLFHEIGHNMQRGEWTFEGCGEVTVNIFSMHAMEHIVGIPIIKQEFVADRKKEFGKYFSKKPTYDNWKNDCHMALMTFVQLIRHFGWDAMYEFMSAYENDIKNNKDALPKTNQDKIDQWVIRYSKIVNRNIKPQFELWGLPVTDKVDQYVSEFPEFCPSDETEASVFYHK